jgi:hypothetical protein
MKPLLYQTHAAVRNKIKEQMVLPTTLLSCILAENVMYPVFISTPDVTETDIKSAARREEPS